MGLEALSRGARLAVFVEEDIDVCAVLERNIEHLLMKEKSRVLMQNVFHARFDRQFDIIFSGAPYTMPVKRALLEKIDNENILKKSGLCIIQHHFKEEYCGYRGRLKCFRSQRYGKTQLSFFASEDV